MALSEKILGYTILKSYRQSSHGHCPRVKPLKRMCSCGWISELLSAPLCIPWWASTVPSNPHTALSWVVACAHIDHLLPFALSLARLRNFQLFLFYVISFLVLTTNYSDIQYRNRFWWLYTHVNRGWRYGLEQVKSKCHSCGGPEIGPQDPCQAVCNCL